MNDVVFQHVSQNQVWCGEKISVKVEVQAVPHLKAFIRINLNFDFNPVIKQIPAL